MKVRVRQLAKVALGLLVLLLLAACPQKTPLITDPTPNPLELAAQVNGSVIDSISFSNSGDAPLTYTASESADWLQINAGWSGTVVPGGSAFIDPSASCPATPSTLTTTLTITSDGGDKTVTVNLSCQSSFTIETRFLGSAFTPAREQVFLEAAERWAEVIIGDLPDIAVNKPADDCDAGEPALNETIDDLLIHAIIEPIDGEGGVLGSAGPCYIRTSGDQLPIYGIMRFDSADIAALEAAGDFDDVILHEMGHVLGIGVYWDFASVLGVAYLDYATNPAGQACRVATNFTAAPTFNGSGASAEFAALGGSGQLPAEDQYGAGTQCSHWDEEFFSTELMTGFVGPSSPLPLSRLTGASLADIGYTVDLTSADPYIIPACSPSCLRAQEARPIEEIILLPKAAVRPDGTVVPLEPARP